MKNCVLVLRQAGAKGKGATIHERTSRPLFDESCET